MHALDGAWVTASDAMAGNAGGRSGGRVNFDEDKQLVFETSANVKPVASFEDMGLKEELLRGIFAYGASADRSPRGRLCV